MISPEDLPDVDARLADYVDGCLAARERERFEAELRVNPRLRAALDAYQRTHQQVRAALSAPIAAVSVVDRVMAAIATGREPAPRAVRPHWPWLAALATAAALLGVAIWLDAWWPAGAAPGERQLAATEKTGAGQPPPPGTLAPPLPAVLPSDQPFLGRVSREDVPGTAGAHEGATGAAPSVIMRLGPDVVAADAWLPEVLVEMPPVRSPEVTTRGGARARSAERAESVDSERRDQQPAPGEPALGAELGAFFRRETTAGAPAPAPFAIRDSSLRFQPLTAAGAAGAARAAESPSSAAPGSAKETAPNRRATGAAGPAPAGPDKAGAEHAPERTWLVEGTRDDLERLLAELAAFVRGAGGVLRSGELRQPPPPGANGPPRASTDAAAAPPEIRMVLRFRSPL